jgi:hypothetical protein
MGASEARRRPPVTPERPLEEIVPARAVLTELARGFLLVQNSNPEHAAQFARSFLKEQVGPPAPDRVVPLERVPIVRRGVATALREPRLDPSRT